MCAIPHEVRWHHLKDVGWACTEVCNQVFPVQNIGMGSGSETESSVGLSQGSLGVVKEHPDTRGGRVDAPQNPHEIISALAGGASQAGGINLSGPRGTLQDGKREDWYDDAVY